MQSNSKWVSNCPALVLAGGFGKRLRTCYDDGPKVLAPVGGQSFLEYLLLWLNESGIKRVILCIGYKGAQLRESLGDGHKFGLEVDYSSEDIPLGTAGALKHAERLVDSDSFFAMNGDSFLDVNLRAMYYQHHSNSAFATLAVTPMSYFDRYGSVELNSKEEIVGFTEKTAAHECEPKVRARTLINGGVYLLQKSFLELIPAGKAVSIERDIFPCLTDGRLRGFVTESYFIDIGIPADYNRAQAELPRRFQYDHTS
ncbi:MAG TPA: nucleotidyltransferase family protein [Terriglobales bacterium]|nr:nucleotidyltransferase family protein [Terriglobales bacterium]